MFVLESLVETLFKLCLINLIRTFKNYSKADIKKTLNVGICIRNSANKYINVILLISLFLHGSRGQRWPVAFWNLSTISVGPLVLDSGGGYDSPTASSIILSSRVNLLSSWNGPEPLCNRSDTILFLPRTWNTNATFSFLFFSQPPRLSIIIYSIAGKARFHSTFPSNQNFEATRLSTIARHVSNKYYSPRVRLFRIVEFSSNNVLCLDLEFWLDWKEESAKNRRETTPLPISRLSRRLIKYYLSSVTCQPNRIKLISPGTGQRFYSPEAKKTIPPLLFLPSLPLLPVNSCFLLLVRRCSMSPRRLYLSTAVDSKSNFLDRRGRTGVRQGKAKREEEIRERRWYAVTQRA